MSTILLKDCDKNGFHSSARNNIPKLLFMIFIAYVYKIIFFFERREKRVFYEFATSANIIQQIGISSENMGSQ